MIEADDVERPRPCGPNGCEVIDGVDEKPGHRIAGDIPGTHRLDNLALATQQQPAALVRRTTARVPNHLRKCFRSYF